METTAENILRFYDSLDLSSLKTKGVEVMNPYKSPEVMEVCEQFYSRFYNDNGKRIFLIAINPGRFGAGVTGIPFTDPAVLEDLLGISNLLPKRKELSGKFIYELIEEWGGVESFYSQFIYSNVSPLGFLKDGKNLNYYDIAQLQEELTPWMVEQLNYQVEKWGRRDIAFTIGKGKNYAFLQKLNKQYGWFDRLETLPHPRWVMQYRLKQKDVILDEMITKLKELV